MKKVLITGVSGFVGTHLAKHLLEKNDIQLIGTYRSESGLSGLETDKERIILEKVDLLDREAADSLIDTHKPDQVYHLAGLPSAGKSFQHPAETVTNNVISGLNILEALKNKGNPHARILIVSTAEVYGKIQPSDLPIDEKTELRPLNPYAVSKISQDYLGLQYHLAYGLDVVRVRPFNHTGPYQKDSFAIPSFAKQIAQTEKGLIDPVLSVGNLDAKKDFTDVRDVVRGYGLLMEQGIAGEVYNIGSGKSYSMNDLLQMLLSLSQKDIKVQEDPEKIRPIEVEEVVCDYSRLNSLTGWKPEIPIEKTLSDILDYWRNIV